MGNVLSTKIVNCYIEDSVGKKIQFDSGFKQTERPVLTVCLQVRHLIARQDTSTKSLFSFHSQFER